MASGIGTLSEKIGDASQTGLDLISKFKENKYYNRGKVPTIHTINPITEEGPYQFIIGGYNCPDLVMLNTLRLTVKFKVVKLDGQNLSDDEHVSLVNSPIHSLFDNIIVQLNGNVISDQTRQYPYKAYFTQTFSYNEQTKKNNLQGEYYLEDDSDKTTVSMPEDIDGDNCESVLAIRKEWIANSKSIQATIIPYIDISSSSNYLSPGHCLHLEFERSRSSFSLLANNNNYKIVIEDLFMTARYLDPTQNISSTLQKYKNNSTIQYQITRNIILTRQFHAGISQIHVNNIFTSGNAKLPRALYVFFQEDGQISGAINKNPFIFTHQNVMESQVFVNGFPYPMRATETNFTENKINIMPAFRTFLDNIGISDNDCDVGITPNKYMTNMFVMAYDLSPTGVRISQIKKCIY